MLCYRHVFFRLDPAIDDVAQYPGITHGQLPYSIKQLISHEVAKEKMRRDEPVSNAKPIPIAKEDKRSKNEGEAEKRKELPNHLRQKLTAKQIEVKERVPVDFFGRKIVQKVDPVSEAEKKANNIIVSDVWFKFKEGYNNAVKRNIRMKDMLL